jgi:hypothetical protein
MNKKRVGKNKKANSRSDFVINNILPKSKRSQVTVFIIIAIIIIGVLIFLLLRPGGLRNLFTPSPPINQIQDCVNEAVEQAVDIVSEQGGSVDPELSYRYKGQNLEYLCYTEEYYAPCVMQRPLLKQHIEKEIENYIQPSVKSCVDSAKVNLQKDGYEVSVGEVSSEVSIVPGTILVDIKSDLTITKDKTESHESIKTDKSSKLYELIMTASSITNWEARYGDAESMMYMIYYPSLKMQKLKQGDGTSVYLLTDRNTLDKLNFASRSMVVPPGLVG